FNQRHSKCATIAVLQSGRNRRAESRSRQTEVEREASRVTNRQQMAESCCRHTEVAYSHVAV
ncbi:unnamed protein product, partial [Didymodactylos carnosus]